MSSYLQGLTEYVFDIIEFLATMKTSTQEYGNLFIVFERRIFVYLSVSLILQYERLQFHMTIRIGNGNLHCVTYVFPFNRNTK